MTAVLRGSGKPAGEVLALSHDVVFLISLLEFLVPREAKKLDQGHTATKWYWHQLGVTSNSLCLDLSPWCWGGKDEKQVRVM